MNMNLYRKLNILSLDYKSQNHERRHSNDLFKYHFDVDLPNHIRFLIYFEIPFFACHPFIRMSNILFQMYVLEKHTKYCISKMKYVSVSCWYFSFSSVAFANQNETD